MLGDSRQLFAEPGGKAVAGVFAARREALAPIVQRLDESMERGELAQPKNKLYQSFAHLHCNRLVGNSSATEQQLMGLLLRTREGLDKAPLQRLSNG